MSLEEFYDCINNGLKRDIKSRRLKMRVSVDEFSALSNKYFKNINDKDLTFKFIVEEFDKMNILFVLRYFFRMYVEIRENSVVVFKNFPNKFDDLKSVASGFVEFFVLAEHCSCVITLTVTAREVWRPLTGRI